MSNEEAIETAMIWAVVSLGATLGAVLSAVFGPPVSALASGSLFVVVAAFGIGIGVGDYNS